MFTRLRLLTLALLTLAGCAVNPVTGEKELSFISAEQEVAIGARNYKPSQQSQGGRYYLDPEIQVYVAQIGQKLAAVSDRPGLPYEFVVLNNPVPNAWALPGGKIAVNSGLLWHLEDESQLAAVLGHEIVHAAARHGASQMSRGTLISLGAQVAGVASQSAGLGNLGGAAAQLGAAAWMARYGREDELEADAYGMDYMVRAGYNPEGAVRLQETFVQLNQNRQSDFVNGLFASHPPSQERVNKNRAKAATLPNTGITNQDIYQKKTARLRKDRPAYEHQDKAIKALEAKTPKAALAELDQAIRIQPNDGYFWELRGHAWAMLKNYDKAEQAFTAAISKNPDLYSHYLSRGILRYERNNKMAALPDLEKSYELLPTPAASYYLGEMAYANGNRAKAIEYYQQAAQSSGELGSQAKAQLVKLELADNPNKYIASEAYVANDGYVRIVLRNNSGITVQNLALQLTEMQSAFIPGKSIHVEGPHRLTPNQQVEVHTLLGPYRGTPNNRRFRVQVIQAIPAP